MEVTTHKRTFAPLLTLALVVAAAAQAQEAAKPKQAKDQAEFDLLQAVNKEVPGPKKIELLQQWEQKYPDTAFVEERAVVLVQTYVAMNKPAELWEASKKLHGISPKNQMAIHYLSQLGLGDPAKAAESDGYTRKYIELIPALPIPDADKKTAETMARKTLGSLAVLRKDFVKAEKEFSEYLKWNPNSGNISYALANAILAQKDKAKQITAMWHLARAAHYAGDDALPDANKTKLQAFFEKNYVAYHGSKAGMQEVIDATLKSPFPPDGWKILSSYEQDELEMEELKQKDPLVYQWVVVKRGLTGPEGAKYWEDLKGSALPKLKGKVISSNPPVKTKEIIVGIRDAANPEMKLILEAPVGKVEPGTEIEFDGAVAKEFTADPFLLTVDMENDKVTGLPKAVGPAKPGMKKAAPGKKK